MFETDTPTNLIGGLLLGFVFGFLLQKGQVTRYKVIVGQFLLVDWTVLRVMLSAIITGSIGVYAMLSLGWIEGLMVKPAVLAANGLGGLIFGVGMASLGYCPGTGVGAAAEGSRHARWGLVGMVVGAGCYAAAYPVIEPTLMHVAAYGKVTFADVTGLSPWVFIAGITAISLALFRLLPSEEASA